MTLDPKKQSIIKAPSRAVAKARSNMASRALASVHKTTLTNSIGMKLKLIPAGEFLMGSPESEPGRDENEAQHRVRITKPFYMQTTPVTQSQWITVMGETPWGESLFNPFHSDSPATHISHNSAVDFCHELSERENATYRLPTEAEWEYSCRAGTTTAYSFGASADELEQYGWCSDNVVDLYAPIVGQKVPNNFGLHDMHGNVWEWCNDWFDSYQNGRVTDPIGPADGTCRVMRGGSWWQTSDHCRSASRYYHHWSNTNFDHDIGFRVCLSPSTANERIEQTTHPETP